MDFDFSADQYALRDEARRFLEKQCPVSHVREFLDDKAGWSRDLWKQMADLGWMALPFPEQYGGLGQSFLDLVLLLGELGRSLGSLLAELLGLVVQLLFVLRRFHHAMNLVSAFAVKSTMGTTRA